MIKEMQTTKIPTAFTIFVRDSSDFFKLNLFAINIIVKLPINNPRPTDIENKIAFHAASIAISPIEDKNKEIPAQDNIRKGFKPATKKPVKKDLNFFISIKFFKLSFSSGGFDLYK